MGQYGLQGSPPDLWSKNSIPTSTFLNSTSLSWVLSLQEVLSRLGKEF